MRGDDYTVRLLPWSEASTSARAIRFAVFVEEQGVPAEIELDGWDERAEHALAFAREGTAIGTARLLPRGRIGRMAVLKDWRRCGVGTALLEAILARARERALPRASLHAQVQAIGFYRRFGFTVRGEQFIEAGIPHVEMELALVPPRS